MIIKDNFKIVLEQTTPWLIIIGVMYVLTRMGLSMSITNTFFVVSTYFCMYKLWKDNSESKPEVIILCIGMLIRILVCLIDIYGSTIITIPFSGDDSINFYNTSVEYYYGDTSRIYTNYPYVLNAIYQMTGLNRFAAQYVNILCWSFSALLMQKSCFLLNINKKLRIVALFLLSFMPFNICISSILMRDMLVFLSISIALYCVLKWMNNGEYENILLSIAVTIPTILIHNCVLAMLLVIGIVVAVYSPQKRKFCVEKKFIFIILGTIAVVTIIFMIPKLRQLFLTQIPFSDVGILDAINGRLGYFYTHTGGSTYLLDKYVTSYTELFFGTIQRIVYFLFSPVPSMWRGIGDIASFVASACIYMLCFFCLAVSFCYKRIDPKRTVLFSVIFFVSAIFAWGVSNAGTAIRHREKILFVVILLTIYCIQLIGKKGKD